MSEQESDGPWTLLARGTGEWEGEERMAPAPWAPEGLEARGRHSARLVLGGRGLASEYVQRVDGEVSVTTHTLIRWDDAREGFVMHFFSSLQAEPTVFQGVREGDRLVFDGESPQGPMRQVLDYGGDGLRARSLAPDGEGGWTTVFEGEYRRTGGEGAGEKESAAGTGDATSPPVGSVAWRDLTVDDASALRDFYAAVVGWIPQGVSMGEYEDWNMVGAGGEPEAGICHARGSNAGLPQVWLVYLVVADLDASLEAVEAGGGEVVKPAATMASLITCS